MDPSGDVTVSFAIRDIGDDPPAIRAGALADTLSVLRGVYGSDEAGRVRTLTVLGTFPFKGTKSPSVHESPVLRAVLSAERAAAVDWSQVSPQAVPTLVDTWWLQGAFAEVGSADAGAAPAAEAQRAAPAAEAQPAAAAAEAGTTVATGALDDLRARLAVAGAHVDASRAALDAGQVRISRAQLLQFFDVWDDVDAAVATLDPPEYEALDAQLERAEVALLHSQPEDVATAGDALGGIQANLAGITSQLPSPPAADH
jgi:hypothetical protein